LLLALLLKIAAKTVDEINEDKPMNNDISAGQWKQMRGDLKSWQGRLTDDELDLIGGHKDKLIG